MNRDRIYLLMMTICVGAVALSWTVIRIYSVTAAIVISMVFMLIPPIADIIANAGDEGTRRR